jgi:hypothetical protein
VVDHRAQPDLKAGFVIKLDPSAVTAAKLDHFATPPTYAKRKVWRCNVLGREDVTAAPSTTGVFLGTDVIDAVYLYGNLDAAGKFASDVRAGTVHVLVDIPAVEPPSSVKIDGMAPEYAARKTAQHALLVKKWYAAHNLRNAGITPDAVEPWMAVTTPAARADDFHEVDMDAIFSSATIGDPRLRGTVVKG